MERSSKPEFRSISLPLRSSTSSTRIQFHLNKIKTLVPFYSSTNIQSGFECLVDLYLSIDECIVSSEIQEANLQYRNSVLVEDALIWSTGLLDSYSKIVELLTLMKENVRTLQSALRRKGVAVEADASCEAHILDYVLHCKTAKKNIVKILGSLEQMERETESCRVSSEEQQFSMVIEVLREAVIATIHFFRALLLRLSGKTKPVNGFSFIAKLIQASSPGCDKNQEIINDNDMIDATLESLRKKIKNTESKTVDVQLVMERLLNLDREIEGYEFGIGCLFRKLIQTRVSLLNVLAN